MSEFALKVKDYYDRGLWSADRIQKAYELGKITEEEYHAITEIKHP